MRIAFRNRLLAQAAVWTTLVSWCITPVQAAVYTVTDLGSLGGGYSYASGINDSGQVTGASYTAEFEYHPFLYSGGMMTDLASLVGDQSSATAVNNSGQITGASYTAEFVVHAFRYSTEGMTDLGSLSDDYSSGEDINDSGQVAGSFGVPSGFRAFLYSDGEMRDLGALPGDEYSSGQAVNESGQVTGDSYSAGFWPPHAFLYADDSMIALGTLGGDFSTGVDVNNSGQVVGTSNLAGPFSSGAYHAYLYSDGVMSDLGTLGENSFGQGVNDSGQVTGFSYLDGVQLAFLYSDGVMTDLNTLVDPGWTIFEALDINNSGQILANGYNSITGEQHALLLSPNSTASTPEPTTLALWSGLGLIGLALRTARRRTSLSQSVCLEPDNTAGTERGQAFSL